MLKLVHFVVVCFGLVLNVASAFSAPEVSNGTDSSVSGGGGGSVTPAEFLVALFDVLKLFYVALEVIRVEMISVRGKRP